MRAKRLPEGAPAFLRAKRRAGSEASRARCGGGGLGGAGEALGFQLPPGHQGAEAGVALVRAGEGEERMYRGIGVSGCRGIRGKDCIGVWGCRRVGGRERVGVSGCRGVGGEECIGVSACRSIGVEVCSIFSFTPILRYSITPILRPTTPILRNFRADHRPDTGGLARLGEAHGSVEPIPVAEPRGPVAQAGASLHEARHVHGARVKGKGRPVEERDEGHNRLLAG